jgi:hypothetical protein
VHVVAPELLLRGFLRGSCMGAGTGRCKPHTSFGSRADVRCIRLLRPLQCVAVALARQCHAQ